MTRCLILALLSVSFIVGPVPTYSQIPGVEIDPLQYWQIRTLSRDPGEGAKIELSNEGYQSFLRMGSTHENMDIFNPFISFPEEGDLLFLTEDPESTSSTEQMRLSHEGKLTLSKQSGTSIRNAVFLADGSISSQFSEGYSGVRSITAHEFVSWDNHGDDQNFRLPGEIVYHENQFLGSAEMLVAPVHLPHGSVIKKIDIYFKDGNESDSLQFSIICIAHQDKSSYVVEQLGKSFYTGKVNSTWYDPSVVSTILNLPIDNVRNFYRIRALGTTASWPGDQVGISSVVVHYDLTGG